MSDSVRPHSQQPTRLPHPWDSPGKNTGMVAVSFSRGVFSIQGILHARMGIVKGRNIKDLTEAEEIKKR